MRALVQRVKEARVTVDDECVGEIGQGLLVLHCVEAGDGAEEADFLARKIAKIRIFADADGKTNLSVQDIGGAVLAVSQFTLAAEWRKGNRPGFSRAGDPALAEQLYERFCAALKENGLPVKTGRFAADMDVSLVNDGPFTIWMDTND
jgi:D-tyrosyl-tRNA(Tyr) deacylase